LKRKVNKNMKNGNVGSLEIQENVKMNEVFTEEEILALINSDALEMPSWDEGCYVR